MSPLLIVLGSSLAAAPQPAALAELLERTARAHGGTKALEAVAVLREEGVVSSTVRGGAEGRMVRVFEHPGRLRVEIAYPGEKLEVRVLDGERGWRQGVPVTGPPLVAMQLQAARMALPRLLLARRAELKDLGEVELEGARLRAVELPLGDGAAVVAYLDPKDGRVQRSAGRAGEGGRAIEFRSVYDGFRKVKGVLLPSRERTYAMGRHTGDTRIEEAEVLPTAPAGSFEP